MTLKAASYFNIACEPLPVLLFGVIFGLKTYKLSKYIFVFVLVTGMILFSIKDRYEAEDGEDPLIGNSVIALSLLMDGSIAASQDRMRLFSKPTPMTFMYYVNLWSFFICTIGAIMFGEVPKFIDFVVDHPDILQYLGLVLLVGAFGQAFTSSIIVHFGSLPLSITQTLRKFFNVFFSVLFFGNSLSIQQWISVSVVFGALFVDAILNNKMKVKDVLKEKVEENAPQTANLENNNNENFKAEISVINLGYEPDTNKE